MDLRKLPFSLKNIKKNSHFYNAALIKGCCSLFTSFYELRQYREKKIVFSLSKLSFKDIYLALSHSHKKRIQDYSQVHTFFSGVLTMTYDNEKMCVRYFQLYDTQGCMFL